MTRLRQGIEKARGTGDEVGMGHMMYCAGKDCRDFRYHGITMEGNGTPALVMRCKRCSHASRFTFVAGGWMPESIVGTLDSFMGSKIGVLRNPEIEPHEHDDLSETPTKLGRLKSAMSWRRKAHDDEVPMTELVDRALDDQRRKSLFSPDDAHLFSTRFERLKAWMTCKRYLLFVALPASVPLLLMGACGVLFYRGIYVHPIYEWIAPLWRPWMYSVWLMVVPIVTSIGLLAGYVRCRLDNKISEIDEELYGEQHGSEHDVLQGIDEL